MASFRTRISRLEDRLNDAPDRAQIVRDAAEVTKRLLASAASFDESAVSMPFADRLAMSPAQHCAWALRFAPDKTDPETIMALHGLTLHDRS